MSNEVNSNGEAGRDPESRPPTSGQDFPTPDMVEDIGHGFVRLRPPATLDDIPFPPVDPDRTADYEWAQNDPEVQARYGGQVVAVRQKQVWGVGHTYPQAGADAASKPNCPPGLVYVYVWPIPPDETNGRRKT